MSKKTSLIILTMNLVILVVNNFFANILEQRLDESTLKELLQRAELS